MVEKEKIMEYLKECIISIFEVTTRVIEKLTNSFEKLLDSKEDKISENGEIMITRERTPEHGEISVQNNLERKTKIITFEVESDFDIKALKAALSGVKAGDYAKSIEHYSENELLDHLIIRTK